MQSDSSTFGRCTWSKGICIQISPAMSGTAACPATTTSPVYKVWLMKFAAIYNRTAVISYGETFQQMERRWVGLWAVNYELYYFGYEPVTSIPDVPTPGSTNHPMSSWLRCNLPLGP
ncbi:hypothetical protein HI914_01930 [Erysiphe necator]|nr:hypothetical protein HI914_01930 [Erysiphe necator]